MNTSNRIIIKQALESFKTHLHLAIVGYWVSLLFLLTALIPHIGVTIMLITAGLFFLVRIIFFKFISGESTYNLKQLISNFTNLKSALIACLLIVIIVFFMTLFFIIPGIIASLTYSMTFYILVDNPSSSAIDALKQSKKMMKGHKWQYFKLLLRFFPILFSFFFLLILMPAVAIAFALPIPRNIHELCLDSLTLYNSLIKVVFIAFAEKPFSFMIIFISISLLLPVMHLSSAKFYNAIKIENEAK